MQQRPGQDVDNWSLLPLILRAMIILSIVTVAVGMLVARRAFFGLLSGAALALLLYYITLLAGRVFTRFHSLVAVMLWLLLAQALLWVGMAVLLVVVQVDAAGFAIGVSVLPGAVILATVYWWLIIHKGVIP